MIARDAPNSRPRLKVGVGPTKGRKKLFSCEPATVPQFRI